ncbi:MAG: penicillin-binding protein 2 [Vampirovibrionales bacterium]|nr:penicillin-binding protein 2 [Vampirovibrionales bacterium]
MALPPAASRPRPVPARPTGTPLAAKPHHVLTRRLQQVGVVAIVVLLVLMGRLVYLQLITGGQLQQKAKQSRSHATSLYHRGTILDRHGMVMAQDQILYDAFAHPEYFGKASPEQIATAIAPVLHMPAARLSEDLSKPLSTIRLASNLEKETVQALRALKIEVDGERKPIGGLDFPKKTVRQYPQGQLAAHVLGYVNDDTGVSSGVEYAQRETLKKAPLLGRLPMLDGHGQLLNIEAFRAPEVVSLPKSDDVTLTIDARLQFIAEKALTEGLAKSKAKRGAVVMLQPKSGDILAFAVTPTYTPEHYYRYGYENLKNWAVSDVYPPGSTMKILTLANGLESGAIQPDSKILDTGRMVIEKWTIQNYDYHKRPHPGMIDLTYLLEHSSNIASAKISMMTPKPLQYELLKRFGFGQPTGLDLPGESAGLLPHYDTWTQSTQASLGYGYGLAATPLQMAAAVAAIANGGVWIQPHVASMGSREPIRRRVLTEKTATDLTQLLAKAIDRPKVSSVRVPGIRIAGKTGTSRKPSNSGKGYSSDLFTSFVGFYPAEKPEVLIFVLVDTPRMAESWGSTVAGPIFKQIVTDSMDYMGIKPMI